MSLLNRDLKNFLFLVPYAASRSEGVPVEEAARKLEVDEDSIGRLLERAIAVGPPDGTPDEMVEIYLEGGRIHTALAQRFLRPPRFSAEELLTLRLVLDRISDDALPALSDAATRLAEKLESLASGPTRGRSDAFRDKVVIQGEGQEEQAHLEKLERAVHLKQKALITYYTASRDALSERHVCPSGMLQFEGSWYMVGEDERIYKVERIRSVELLAETHEFSADLDLAEKRLRMQSGPREAILEVHGEEERSALVSDTYFIARMLSAQGTERVLEPADLRRKVQQVARRLRAKYESDSSESP